MDDKVYFAKEISENLGLSEKEIIVLAKIMGMPKIFGSYRFTEKHIEKIKEAVVVIKNIVP